MKNNLHISKRTFQFFIGLLLFLVSNNSVGQYAIKSADNLYFCESIYPTGYQTMSQFYIYETDKKKFNQGQNDKSLIFTLPAGFEFNPGIGTASLSNTGDWDTGGSPFAWVVGTNTITVSGIYTDGQGTFDTIYFDGIQVNATSSGNSGDLVRTGGSMDIDGSTNNPGATESFGYMFADLPMTYTSSQVTQPNTNNIRKSCGTDVDILEIKISVTGNCPAEITQFDFNTLGDPGYTQNPLINLTGASVYYAGTTSGFATTELFGNVTSPNGAFTITGSKLLLSAGDHYFYLTYDIPITANTGDNMDASMTSFILDGTTYSNMATPNPGGFRPITNDLCLQPDLPNPNANMTSIPQGSLVIPMDNTNQSLTGGLFNLKAYGLIHALVNEDVPVMWVIRSGKNKDDIDYSANSTRVYPDTVASSNIDYTSGMFVIDSSWVNTPFSQWVLSAWQVIQPYGNQVAVYKLDQDVNWDVRYNLSQRTKLAVFNNGGNDPIHVNILNSAGCTNYFTVGAGVFAGIDACYTFCSEPHWAGTLADSAITENVRSFINRGGNFLAQCRGVETYENYSLENMHSTGGIDILNTTVSHSYNNVDMAFMQFEGILTENEGGSERNWILSEATGSGWRPNKFWYGVSDSDIDTIVASGAHMRHPDSVGGNVFYMGGHDYAPYSDVESINAARMYMNATLIPSGRPTLFNLDPGDSLFTCTNYPIQLGGSPTGPNDATYSWTGPNLDDPTAQNPIATPSDTSVYTVLAYRGGCIVGPYSVTVTVREVPVVDAGTDVNLCNDQNSLALTGTVTNSTGGEWTSSGTGSFANPNSLNTTYTFSVADVSFGSVDLHLTSKGGCDSIADTLSVIFSPVPIVNAGIDISTCKDVSTVGLNGSVANATGGIWTTSGTGTFNPSANSLTGNYIPTAADTATGSVTLTLTTTGSGVCNALTDNVIITFTDTPTANAGIDQTVCGDVTGITLNGSVVIASGGSWITNGTGTFSPNNTSLGAIYVPSSVDTAAGGVTLTLTTTGNGLCQAYNDQMNIVINPTPVVSAGSNQTVCGDIASIPLNGSVSNAGGGSWTTSGTGSFSPNNTTLNANYIPSSGDTLAGNVTLTLTTTGNGTCNTYNHAVIITFTNAPTVNAGTDITTCKDVTSIGLSGSVTTATGGTWSSSGTGTFSPSANSLTGNYIPSAADTAAGGVTLTLTTTGNGLCNAYTDIVLITLTNVPTVNAGTDQTVCGDVSGITLNGIVTIATGGNWTTNGTGTFSPNSTSLGALYTPSATDTAAGSVTLTLTSTGNGLCQTYSDQMNIVINATPVVSAGSDFTVCGDIAAVPLNGSVSNAGGGSWASSGTGSFSPNNTTLNANYIPSSGDTLAGTVALTLTTTGNGTCNTYTNTITVTFTNAPTVSAGSDIITCKDIASISLSGSIATATGGTWSSSGSGSFSPSANSLNGDYIPSTADTAAGGVTLTLTTTGNGTCNAYIDNVIITLTELPTADAGIDQTICADAVNLPLSGSVTIGSGGSWSTSGTGTFSPDNISLGASYIPSSADTTAGTVTLTLTTTGNGLCQAYTDQMTITVTPAPVVSAGADQTVCGDIAAVGLIGTVINAGGGSWTTSGTGSFSPNNTTLNASYIPSTADTSAGSVTLTLVTTGNGSCNAYSDNAIITFTNAPTLSAGSDITTCKDIVSINLAGSVATATGGTWTSSGTGSFTPSANSLNGDYIPSTADTAAGGVTLTLTTTGNGTCNAYTDNVIITLTELPTANAGTDQTICADAVNLPLSGSVTIASGGSWSTSGTGTFSPDNISLGASYIPSDADTTAGSVILTLTTTGNGLCNAYNDQMTITISSAPVVSAGTDQTVCGDIAAVILNGSVSNATGGSWSTSGTGTFSPNNTTLNAGYIPSTADTAAGNVTLTLITTGNGSCNSYTNDVVITFTNAPTADAGVDVTTCKDITSVSLSGSVVTATGGTWSTSGSGTFNPNVNTLTAAYIPSAADTAAGTVTLTLTTTGNGLCSSYSDNMIITFTDIPSAIAGSNQTVCADITGVSLNGGVLISSGGSWATNGTGTFSPNNTTLNATYIPSAGDTTVGNVVLTLTTTGNGGCNAYNDQVTIIITPAPVAFAGNDTSVCSTNAIVPLNGSVYTATGGQWSTNGSGTFTPSNTDLNATYQTSLGDQTNGAVEIYLTTTGNGLCNSVTDTMNLTITPTSITVFVGNDTLVCGDDSLSLNGVITTATGGIWSTLGDGTFSDTTDLNASYYFGPNDTVANTVDLYLTTTGNGGCNAQIDSFQVDIQDPLELTVLSADTACRNGGAINISSVSNTGQGYWITNGDGAFLPDSATLNPQYLPGSNDTASNNITLTFITENNGVCSAINDSLYIEMIDAPNVNFGFADICLNETVFFTDSSSAIGGITTWNWDFNDTILSSMQDTNVTFTSYGAQTATLVVTSGYGCIDSLTQNIIVSPLPVAALTSNADCYDDSVELFDASTVATGSIVGWEWTIENGFTGTTQDVSVIFDSASVYSATLIVTTDMGCTDTITDSLRVQPNPVASFVSDSVCLNNLSSMVDVSAVEFGTIISWEWIIEGTSTDTLPTTSYTFGSDSLQPVTLIVTSSYGCIDTLVQDVVVHPLPNNAFSYEGFCEEDDVLFTDETAINSGQIVAWDWDFGNSVTSIEQHPSNGYGVTGTFNVTLITTSEYGCLDTISQNISISPNPSAAFSMSDGSSDIVVTQVLDDVFFNDESTDASQWDWDFGDNLGTSLDQNPTYAFNPYGQYNVNLTITNDYGCTDTVSHIITVKQPPQLPLAFSPNGDGLNDVFYVLGGTFVEFRFEIYNNWGKMIFESNDPLVGWDGTHLDIAQPLGVYVWIYHVVTEDGVEYSAHGDVTIIR